MPEPADRPMGILPAPNPEPRSCMATVDGAVYARQPVRTHLVTDADDAAEVVRRYVTPLPDDTVLVAVSERMVAITEGRSHPMTSIRPGRLARFLVRFVTRPGYGIGLGTAETMQLAIDEVGAPRILLAAAVSGADQAVRRARPLLPDRRAPGRGDRRPDHVHHPAVQPGGDARPQGSGSCGPRDLPQRSARRWRSSTPTTPAATCSAPARPRAAPRASDSSPTTRWARPGSRRRSRRAPRRVAGGRAAVPPSRCAA